MRPSREARLQYLELAVLAHSERILPSFRGIQQEHLSVWARYEPAAAPFIRYDADVAAALQAADHTGFIRARNKHVRADAAA
jgi:hypothetical protein